MSTPVSELREMLKREINVPGFGQLPGITNTQLDGYISDGFWEARLMGVLSSYTLTDGSELATPVASIYLAADESDLPPQYQVLVVIVAGLRLLRLKALNLAVSLRAKAAAVEYEQQTSATVLREILQSLERRAATLFSLYSDVLGQGAFNYFDGELQRTSSMIQGLNLLTVT
jgi:hypothetical protein